MAGLGPAGFEAKSTEDIQADLEAGLRSAVSPAIDLSPESPNGQFVGVLVGRIRALWELGQALYGAAYPDSASGWSLDQVSAITGTTRAAAVPSTVPCTVDLDAGTYAARSLVAHVDGDPTARFVNSEEVVSTGGSMTVDFEGETTGPTRANAGTLTEIAEAVSGWNSITNPLDAVLGSDIESDASLRARRQAELARRGSTSLDAIRVDILDVADVTYCTVLGNDTDTVDGNGLPGHSVEAIVLGGDDAEVATALFQAKAAGTRTYSSGTTVTETVLDSMGTSHTVTFSRPADLNIYLDVFLTRDPLTYGGDTAVKNALVDFAASEYSVGDDVILSRLVAAIFAAVPGVLDVTEIQAGTSPSPSGTTNITVGVRQLARFDTSRITVTVA